MRIETIELILLNETINHPPTEINQMETMTINKDQEDAIMQAKVDILTTQLVSELVEQLEKLGATKDTKIKCLGDKTLEELKDWLQEDELVTIYPSCTAIAQAKRRRSDDRPQ